MNIKDVEEWMQFADNDFYSAQILNESVRKPYEIICYHCAQSVEKYLKGYLIYNDIVPERTHNLYYLNTVCIERNKIFETIKTECGFLNRFANEIRYPNKLEINLEDVKTSIKYVESIRNFEPIINLRNEIMKEEENDLN